MQDYINQKIQVKNNKLFLFDVIRKLLTSIKNVPSAFSVSVISLVQNRQRAKQIKSPVFPYSSQITNYFLQPDALLIFHSSKA